MLTNYATLMPRRPSKKPHPRVPFSKDEDDKLKEFVKQYGTNWNIIADKMENRNPRQCKERWTHYLSPDIVLKPWTMEEDEFLKKKLFEFGPKWVKISRFFPNRTDIQLKNRWFVLIRKESKQRRKDLKNVIGQSHETNDNVNTYGFTFNLNSSEFQKFNELLENMKWEYDFQT